MTVEAELLPADPLIPHLRSHSFLTQVWIISRHYSDDQRMGSLFQRIAREIGDRVEGAIDLRQLFRQSPQEAVELVRVCKSVLEHWYLTYMQVSWS